VPRGVPNVAKLAWVRVCAPLPVRLLKVYVGIAGGGPSSDAIAACRMLAFILFVAVNDEPNRRLAPPLTRSMEGIGTQSVGPTSAAAAVTATTTTATTGATAGVFLGKSLAISRVFPINDVERRQADVRDFLIPQRDFGFHRLGLKRSVPRQSFLRVRHGRHSKIWPPSGISM
jgi:hypothetical protein